ncbi:hypothetical protein Ancab_001708 [Ancistrocladus abbreviatus]
MLGNLIAPDTSEEWTGCQGNSWLYFSHVQGLDICGAGQLDGQGSLWWMNSNPSALHFNNCPSLHVHGITSLNSPKNHISINNCQNAKLSHVRLIAPEDSPNTDGIDISSSNNVLVYHSFIATGDDCIAINAGSSFINITGVTCGPGHGISVGSLGANGAYEVVEHVLVKNCTFNGTQNGARIKTWEGGSGYAKNITFEEIILDNTKNPIIIDQNYCVGQHDCPNATSTVQVRDVMYRAIHGKTSAVQVRDVMYRAIHGTSASEIAINLDCNVRVPCINLLFDHVKLAPFVKTVELKASCQNAQGVALSSTLSVPCLKGS